MIQTPVPSKSAQPPKPANGVTPKPNTSAPVPSTANPTSAPTKGASPLNASQPPVKQKKDEPVPPVKNIAEIVKNEVPEPKKAEEVAKEEPKEANDEPLLFTSPPLEDGNTSSPSALDLNVESPIHLEEFADSSSNTTAEQPEVEIQTIVEEASEQESTQVNNNKQTQEENQLEKAVPL